MGVLSIAAMTEVGGSGGSVSYHGSKETAKLLESLNLQDEEMDDLIWEHETDVEEIKPK